MEKLQKRHFSNLDASRFFAFFLVFLAHCIFRIDTEHDHFFHDIEQYLKFGILGLDYFFVLSSFLITWILLEERQVRGTFELKNFVIRRSLRIWPLYFLIVGLAYGLYYFSSFLDVPMAELPPIWYYLFFASNFFIANHGTEFLFFLVFLWSIAVEEQFYILWAFLNKLPRISVPIAASLCILASIVFRYLSYQSNPNAFSVHTLSVIGDFGVGALVAYLAFVQHAVIEKLKSLNRGYSYALLLAIILLLFAFPFLQDFSHWMILSRLVFSLLFALLIVDWSLKPNPLFDLEQYGWLKHWGKISYGLYCYHGVVITFLTLGLNAFDVGKSTWQVLLIQPVLAFGFTLLIAHLSYRYFESFFLKLKRRFY